jgi:hypothetical protein
MVCLSCCSKCPHLPPVIGRSPAFYCGNVGVCHSAEHAVSAPLWRLPRAEGAAMSARYPNWTVAAAWLLTVALAAVIYFVPVTRLVDSVADHFNTVTAAEY